MNRRIIRAATLAAIIVFLSLSSCAEDGIQINARRDIYAATAGLSRVSLPNSEESENTSVRLLPALNAARYKERFTAADRLSEAALKLIEASGEAIAFVNAKNNYERGETVVLSAVCRPDTVCILKIRYKSGYSSAQGLGEATTDANGYAVWKFKIGNVASSDEFVPWFEVSCGADTVKHSFTVGNTAVEKTATAEIEDKANKNTAETQAVETLIAETKAEETNASTTAAPETIASETAASAETVPAAVSPASVINFVDAAASYYRGETVTLTVRGLPNTVYTLKVRYKSGYSTAQGLGEAESDANGTVSWCFKISANVSADFEPWFEVTGGSETKTKTFKITDDVASADISDKSDITAQTISEPAQTETSVSGDSGTMIFTDLRMSYSRGEAVTLTVKGLPDTVYTLKIRYKSGYSTAQGLGDAKSDADGVVSWSFKIGSRVDTAFKSYFEVTGGGENVIRYFKVTD